MARFNSRFCLGTTTDDLKLGAKPDMPYRIQHFYLFLTHTLWFLPNVASCFAMANLLKRNNVFYHDYKIIIVLPLVQG